MKNIIKKWLGLEELDKKECNHDDRPAFKDGKAIMICKKCGDFCGVVDFMCFFPITKCCESCKSHPNEPYYCLKSNCKCHGKEVQDKLMEERNERMAKERKESVDRFRLNNPS